MRARLAAVCLAAAALVACGSNNNGTAPPDASTEGGPSGDAGDVTLNVEGLWVIGWVGNLNHFSWVRFDSLAGGGQADYLPGTEIPANAPYWSCSGTGSWGLAQKPSTVTLSFPGACNLPPLTLTFDSIFAHVGYPNGATLEAKISTNPASQQLQGLKFPNTQCNAAMTMCMNPF